MGSRLGYRSADGTTYFEHQDTLGTERMRTNYGGSVGSTYRSLPWGDGYTATVNSSGADQDNAHFADLERDAESGTEHAQFRNYTSKQGRWLAPDPYSGSYDLTNPQSMNRYMYVLNNPMSLLDPSGLDASPDPCDNINGIPTYCAGNGPGVPAPSNNNCAAQGTEGCIAWPCLLVPQACTILASTGHQSPVNVGSSGTTSAPSNCNQLPGTSSAIVSGSATSNIPTIEAGAAIGGAIGGPVGAFVGGIFGSFFGIGVTASYVPSTHSWYGGPTVVFGLGVGGGSGVGANAVNVPYSQNPNSIASGLSYSLTYQPSAALGSTVQYSPGSGPPVVGPSAGTRIPVSAGVSYNIPINKGHC